MSIILDLVKKIEDATANPDRATQVFNFLLSDADICASGLMFHRGAGVAYRTGVSLNIGCGIRAGGGSSGGAGQPFALTTPAP
jgi:hypothetical protein